MRFSTVFRFFLFISACALPHDNVIQFKRVVVKGKDVGYKRVLISEVRLNLPLGDEFPTTGHAGGLHLHEDNQLNMENFSYLRLGECQMRGSQVVVLSDRLQVNGTDFLILDPAHDRWKVLVPEASALGREWNRDPKWTRLERLHLEKECVKLLKTLRDEETLGGTSMIIVMVPLLTLLVLIGIGLSNFIIFKKHGAQVGGVLGSIIHYPAHYLGVQSDGQKTLNV